MVEETAKEKVVVREPLPPMASDNPEQIRRDLKQGALSDKLRGALKEYRKTKRKEVIQKILSVLGGAFRTLRTKDAAQGIAFMQNLAPKMEGMTPTEKAEAIAPLVKQLSQEEQKRAAEYGKLVGKAIDTEKEALKSYLSQLGRFASAQGTTAAAQLRTETAAFKERMSDLEAEGSGMSRDTYGIAKSIKAAAKANAKQPDGIVDQEEFNKFVNREATRVLSDDTVEKSQKVALLKNLRPNLGPDADVAIQSLGGNVEQDDAETAQKRSALIADFQSRVRRYGPSVSKFMKDSDERLANVSANTNKAISEFREKNPMDKVFGPSAAAASAQASIEQIQEAPDRAFRSQILKGKISEMEEAQPYMQGPDGFKELLSFHKSREKARRRGEVFKTPAPPSAVYGAETQVAVDEEPDGTNPTAA